MVANAFLAATSMCTEDMWGDTLCPDVQRNIIVVRTPSRENAEHYVRVREIVGLGRTNKVSAYEGAPHSTFKGFIRGIPLVDGPDVIENAVNDLNPLTLAAKHIGSTVTVVVCFDVAHSVTVLNVCPSPGDILRQGCGASNPETQHECTPEGRLCSGHHFMADDFSDAVPGPFQRLFRSRGVSRGGGRYLSGSSYKSRSRSAGGQQQPACVSARSKKTGSLTWGDTVRGDSPEVLSGSLLSTLKRVRYRAAQT
ncbi:hypothetical protein MTO96_050831 [Rhipicephalus appendiculatus]